MHNTSPSERIAGPGFIAALDQSGGSTPKALAEYGVTADAWNGEKEMYERVHEMRTRIITNPAFDERVSGVILFQKTAEGQVQGMPTPRYLHEVKGMAPILKIDDGLAAIDNSAQLMKPIGSLDERLQWAKQNDVFGTKMRSVIHGPNEAGIQQIVAQQFDVASRISAMGLMPIIEPEVNIHDPQKRLTEQMMKDTISHYLDALPPEQQVMLKLTLPDQADLYEELAHHPRVLRVVALSGGYSRDEANKRLSENKGVTASFSRALLQDLRAQQTDAEFTAALHSAIQSIYDASTKKKAA